MLIVEPETVWSWRRSFLIAALIAATSVAGLWIVDQINEAMEYDLSNWIFFPLFFGIGLVYPLAMITLSYKRLPSPYLGLMFALGYGIGWYATVEISQIAEYGPWKGFRLEERTLSNLLFRHLTRLAMEIAVIVPVAMAAWGICRAVRGRVFLQDGSLCGKCAYNLTGNESGVCPECGTPISQER